jgi:transposase
MKQTQLKNYSKYVIKSNGEIYSLYKNITMNQVLQERIGYYRIQLKADDGTKNTLLVHRLVALAFIPNPENKPEVNHIDGNKLNNDVSNLEWTTKHENMKHAHLLKLRDNNGTGNPRNLLTEKEVLDIYDKLLDGARVSDLATSYNVSRPTISDIKSKRNWQELLSDLPDIRHNAKQESLSENTVRWICSELQQGTRVCDILKKSRNKNITEYQIFNIKRKRTFLYISCNYSW